MSRAHTVQGEHVFSVLAGRTTGVVTPRSLAAAARGLQEVADADALAPAFTALFGGEELHYDDFMMFWASLPDGAAPEDPGADTALQSSVKALLSRVQHVAALAGNAALGRLTAVEVGGTFPTLGWRMAHVARGGLQGEEEGGALPPTWHGTALTPLPPPPSPPSPWDPVAAAAALSPGAPPPPPGRGLQWDNAAGPVGGGRDPDLPPLIRTLQGADPHPSTDAGPIATGRGTGLWTVRDVGGGGSGAPRRISPWHDIPLLNHDGTLNMVTEIPKWSRAKVECALDEPWNPLAVDTKGGRPRLYTWGDMPFNYGFLPQTWEDPAHVHGDTGVGGDGDPLDVLDLGARPWPTGAVVRVKPLGMLAMVDGGEMDWKLLTVAVSDPMAGMLSCSQDVQLHLPGALAAAHRWLALYKWPDLNAFAFDGRVLDVPHSMAVVAETHECWRRLVAQGGDGGCSLPQWGGSDN